MTQPNGTILVGYDFSGTATEAMKVAFSIASHTGQRVHGVSVMERRFERRLVRNTELFFDGRSETTREAAVQQAVVLLEKRMEQDIRELLPGEVPFDFEVVRGKPFKELLRIAGDRETTLIVVGATGLSKTDAWVLGSTAERLARRASIPTLVVRRSATWEPRRILCPTDFSSGAAVALAEAVRLARSCDAALHLLHVVAGTETGELQALGLLNRDDVRRYFEVTRYRAERDMERFLAGVDLEGIATKQQILHGRPHEAILNYAQDLKIDLIVMGSLGRNELSDLIIGNTTERVMRRMPCSVLTVKPAPK